MYINDLVSVLIPCYNMGSMIHRQLDSVLIQDYPSMEIIVIDDGSTDNSAEVIKSYIPKFESRGITLNYVFQKNQGLACTINNGLALTKGEFLVWPDSDDFYNSNNVITKLVTVLKTAPANIQIARVQNIVLDSKLQPQYIRGLNSDVISKGKKLFEDCLYIKNNFYFCAGAYMIRIKKFLECSKYPFSTPKEGGQNWQLLLPMFYHFDCITIKEPLYSIVEHSDSHGRIDKGYQGNISRINGYECTLVETINNIIGMSDKERSHHIINIKRKYARQKMNLAYEAHHSDCGKYVRELIHLGDAKIKDIIRAVVCSLRYKT